MSRASRIASWMCSISTRSFKTYVPDRPSHDRRYLLDSSKIRSELGWRPEVAFEEGFRRTVLWYRDNPDWWRALVDRLRIDEAGWADTSGGQPAP